MRVDLALERQELRVLTRKVTFLLPQLILIDRVGEIVVDLNDPVLVLLEVFTAAFTECIAQDRDSVGDGPFEKL